MDLAEPLPPDMANPSIPITDSHLLCEEPPSVLLSMITALKEFLPQTIPHLITSCQHP